MAKVTTGTGDGGYTGLLGDQRVPKYDLRPEALGTIDEATSFIGLARSMIEENEIQQLLLVIQRDLYTAMAEVATPLENLHILHQRITEERVKWLESAETTLKEQFEIPARFIIPGETKAGALLDVSRTIIRRGERWIAKLQHENLLDNFFILQYLNRCSDYIFILARYVETKSGGSTLA